MGREEVTLATHCLRAASLVAPSMAQRRMLTDLMLEDKVSSLLGRVEVPSERASGVWDRPGSSSEGNMMGEVVEAPVGASASGISDANLREGAALAAAPALGLW